LGDNLELPEAFYDSLREGPRSTRVEHVDDSLVAVLNDVRYDFSFDTGDISTLWLSVQKRVMVSARVKSLRAIERLRASVKGGECFRSPVELLAHLLRDQADGLVQIVREATVRVDRVEDDLLAPEPAALFRLLNRPPEWIAEEDLRELRESAEEFSTAIADASALVERVRLIQEELATLINEQNNKSLFVLTIVTVLALPINIIAGLFGMNVGGIPLAQHGSGFWVVVAIVATFTGIAGFWAFRKRGDA
jgi:zinc transporter